MIQKKIFDLHDALISKGFDSEAFEIIKLAAANIAEDLLSEAEINMGYSNPSEWRTIISKTRGVSIGEIKSTLLSLGADFIKTIGQNTDHDKYRAESIIAVSDALKDPIKSRSIPLEAAEYFKHTFLQCSERFFFTVQRAANSYVPATSFTSSFWKFAKCLAAAKIIIEKYLSSKPEKENTEDSDYKSRLFSILLERKEKAQKEMNDAYEASDNNNLMRLIDENEEIDNKIKNFWQTT